MRIGAPKEDSQLLTRTVAWQQFVTCASPAYLDARGVPQVPGDLYGHDKIAFLAGEKAMPWRFHTEAGLHLCEDPGRLNIDSSEAMLDGARAGFGLIHLPTYITGDDLRAGTLVEVLQAYRPPADPIRIVYPSKRHVSPRVRGFIDLLVASWEPGVPWEY